MGKRGPKSANSRESPPNKAQSAYLSAADRGLDHAERAEWNRIVRAKEPGFYLEDDADLLVQLCQAWSARNRLWKLENEAVAKKAGKASLLILTQWREQAKLVSMLARQLKIGASARETHRATARASQASRPEVRSARAGLMYGEGAEAPADRLN